MMIDDVRYRIGKLRAARFEQFCCALLSRLEHGRRFGRIDGGVNADGETTTGTYDALAVLPSGKFAAFQFTVQREKQRQKLTGDIAKLADADRCSIHEDIEEVVLCLSQPLRHPRALYEAEAARYHWRLTIFALDELAEVAAKHPDLCDRFLDTSYAAEPLLSVSPPAVEPTFRCGARIRAARRDTGLRQSEFVELLGFPGEAALDSLERNRHACPISLIASVAEATGVSAAWLTHGTGTPYAAQKHAFSMTDLDADMDVITALCPERLYVCLDRYSYRVALVVRSRGYHWTVFDDLFQIDVHRWIGDQHEIAGVYAFLNHLFARFEGGASRTTVESRILSWITYRRLVDGRVCPKALLAKHPVRRSDGQTNHWADDIRDIYHRFPIAATYRSRYGAWFLQAQACFRAFVPENETVRPWRAKFASPETE